MMTTQDVIEKLNASDIKWISLQFLDINGNLKETNLRRDLFSEIDFSRGIKAGELRRVFNEDRELKLVPNPDTYMELPWADRVARMMCKIVDKEGRYLKDPTAPLDRIKNNLSAVGISDFKVKQSFQFYIFTAYGVDRTLKQRGPAVTIDSTEGPWNPTVLKQEPRDLSTYPYDVHKALRQQLTDIITQFTSYVVEKHYHGPSTAQQSIELAELDGEDAANAFVIIKQITKVTSALNGLYATFMPLPIPSEEGNSLKLKFTLWKKINNVFYDKDDKLNISQKARYFIGGILEHIESLLIMTNPSTNSFKRFFTKKFYTSWGTDDLGHAVYLDGEGTDIGITLSFPDPLVNPYMAYAAILSAGLDGVKKKIDPGDALTESPRYLTSRDRKKYKVREFPRDMFASIEALESDNDYLKGIFPPELLVDYLEIKIKEFKENSSMPTAYEFDRYFSL